MTLLGGVATAAGWVDWPALGRWIRPHAVLLVAFAVAAALLAKAVQRALRRGPERLRPARALSWWVVAVAAVVIAGVAWSATTWLLREADRSRDPAAARVEAIKTGLGTAAGAAGVFALLLAVRRQWHQELSAAATELDAAEKRVTELYTKAVEQLGSAQAPVRLGGLYALERVAQNNPDQRQTIVNVLCAYLRMPYQPPGDPPTDENGMAEHRERVQEREVRLTAQRLIEDHLQPGDTKNPATTFWKDIDLDLTGAVLIDFTLYACRVRAANFHAANFAGNAGFVEATFTDDADFGSAIFSGRAGFEFATFTRRANFESAIFSGNAGFWAATFIGNVTFEAAIFTGFANFGTAKFNDSTIGLGLIPTTFAGFESATFKGGASKEVSSFLQRSAEAEAADQRLPDG